MLLAGFLASVWARRPHQALLLSYTLVGVWVGFFPFLSFVVRLRPPATIPELVLYLSNPFCAAFGQILPLGLVLCASRPCSSSSRSSFRSFSFAWRAGGCGRRSFPRPAGRGDASKPTPRLGWWITSPVLRRRQPRALARMAPQTAVALDRPVLDRLRHHLHTREPLHSGLLLSRLGP